MNNNKISPQLGKDLAKVSFKELKRLEAKQLLISKKLDGACIILHYHAGKLHLYTREGHDIHLGFFQESLESVLFLRNFRDFVAIAELTEGDGMLGSRNKSNGFVIKAVAARKKGLSVPVPDEVSINVFDFVLLSDMYSKTSKRERYANSLALANLSPYLKVIEQEEVNFEEAKVLAGLWIVDGFEGAIIADVDAPYEVGKRNINQVKIKQVNQLMCKVIDTVEGEGKYAGMVGSLLVECEATGKIFNVGSGLTDTQRASEKLVGRKCVVHYESMSLFGHYLQPVVKKILNTVYYEI